MNILNILNKKMTTPTPYGDINSSWFHYLSLIIIFVFTYFFTKSLKNNSKEKLNKKLLIILIVLVVFEVYKQLIFSYESNWEYQWYAFPFQFCSVPIYTIFVALMTKNEKVRDGILTFLATYSLFAGAAVVLYPGDVFTEIIGINIQTMIHHGLMVVLGFGLLRYQISLKNRSFYRAIAVFMTLILIAIILNFYFNTFINDGVFNMFFINPKFENHLPILKDIQPHVNSLIFILIYGFSFTFIAFIFFYTRILLSKSKSSSIYTNNSIGG